ncbi:MAG: penicillin-binding protein 1A [Maribacter sp.]|jgi:penicillin-binding protein 1A
MYIEEIQIITVKPKNPIWSKVAKILGILIVLGFFAFISFILSIRFGAFGDLPSKEELANIDNHIASEIYTSDGVLMGKFFRENRTNVSLESMAPSVIDALVATEDSRFYEHNGVDYWSLFRVLFKTILGGDESSGGGSTLSQQLAKNLYPRKNAIHIAKVKEMFIAQRLEDVYTKDQILTLYLNTVSFGEEVFGIGVASERYFNTSPSKLKIEQAAVLVGMLKATSYYNPKANPERAEGRRNVVLDQMVAYDKIEQSVSDSLKKRPMRINYHLISTNVGLAPHFREHIRAELKEWIGQYTKPDGTPYNLYTDGLKIRTTINSRMQRYAEQAVKVHLKDLQKSFDDHWEGGKPWGSDKMIEKAKKKTTRYKALKAAGLSASAINKNFAKPRKMTIFQWGKGDVRKTVSPLDSLRYYYCLLNTGFLVMEPQTGKIQAWVGGTNFKYFKYDHVKSKRQVGSTFKPIVYATALKQGYQACDYFYNRNTIYSDYDDWEPKNSNGKYGGMLSMEGGLMNSVNAITVDVIMRTGVEDVIKLAQQMGVKSHIPEVPSIALGTANISLFEMTQVYATLANGGVHTKPKYILRVEDSEGRLIDNFLPTTKEEIANDTTRVMTKEQAMMMTHILQSVVDKGTARRLRLKYEFTNQIAGKTGTTQSHADGWFMGYTPKLVAGVWVGADDPGVHFRDISLGQGANMALPIWAEFMKRVYADSKFKKMESDTFYMSEDVAWQLECPNQITEEEFYFFQNQYRLHDEIVVEDDWQIQAEVAPGFSDKVKKKPKNNLSAKDREKALKKKERTKKKNRRKEKRKDFFKKFFD